MAVVRYCGASDHPAAGLACWSSNAVSGRRAGASPTSSLIERESIEPNKLFPRDSGSLLKVRAEPEFQQNTNSPSISPVVQVSRESTFALLDLRDSCGKLPRSLANMALHDGESSSHV